jgi:hypothetical protein
VTAGLAKWFRLCLQQVEEAKMSQNDELKKLSRKAYLSYHQDGLIDILIGLGILGFGLMMLTGSVIFNMLAWLPILLYVPLKNRITVPRFGYVQFTSERVKKQRLVIALMVGLLLFSFLLGLFVFNFYDDMPPLLEILLAGDGMLLIGGMFALMLLVAGLVTRLDRLIGYAILTMLIVPGGAVLGIAPEFRVIFLGAMILVIGIMLLARFLRAYPLPKDGPA